MSARARILGRIEAVALRRARHPGAYPAPALPGDVASFERQLHEVGGRFHGPLPVKPLSATLRKLALELAEGGRVLAEPSALALARGTSFETPAADARGHAFSDVSVAIVRGDVGCAENAAIALLGADLPHRALPFLCQHLIILIDVERIAPDLHTAQAWLPEDALAHSHLTWVSGPSKTADIEQTLVYGAHGPLTLDVIGLRGSADSGT